MDFLVKFCYVFKLGEEVMLINDFRKMNVLKNYVLYFKYR